MTKKDPRADQWGLLPHSTPCTPTGFCPLHGMRLKGTLAHQHHPWFPLRSTVAGKPAKALTPSYPSLLSPPAVLPEISTLEGSGPES